MRTAMSDWGMATNLLQTDKRYPTGSVKVTFDDGEPSYDIIHPSAYDAVEATSQLPACSLLYHGSLALRDEKSQQALAQIKSNKPKTVFIDVNLRAPWYQLEQVQQMLHTANWVKLNSDELNLLYPDVQDSSTIAADFLRTYKLDGLVLTHGAKTCRSFHCK